MVSVQFKAPIFLLFKAFCQFLVRPGTEAKLLSRCGACTCYSVLTSHPSSPLLLHTGQLPVCQTRPTRPGPWTCATVPRLPCFLCYLFAGMAPSHPQTSPVPSSSSFSSKNSSLCHPGSSSAAPPLSVTGSFVRSLHTVFHCDNFTFFSSCLFSFKIENRSLNCSCTSCLAQCLPSP